MLFRSFIEKLVKEHSVAPHNIFIIEPLTKEFSIQQIRLIKKEVIYKAKEPRLYVLRQFDTASYEAQNAFLKTLEQPPRGVSFVLVVSNKYRLLPTVQSRATTHILVEKEKSEASTNAVDAALSDLIERADLSILSGSALSTKTYSNPLHLYDEIIRFFRSRISQDSKTTSILRKALLLRSYVSNNHGDSQNGIDQLAISIYKLYSQMV